MMVGMDITTETRAPKRPCAVADCGRRAHEPWGLCRTHIRELQAEAPKPARVRRERETLDYLEMVARMIRSAGRRVGDADEPELSAMLGLQAVLDEAVQTAVDGQHIGLGRSWAYIALATGTSRQAAAKRWAKPGENEGK
jgi:hypothetical protein